MKTTTCKNLKGACDFEIQGATAEEMGQKSRAHVMEMVQAGDQAHKDAMDKMMELSHEDQMKWYQEFTNSFDSLEDATNKNS